MTEPTAASRLLDKLEKVTESGPSSWMARCPAHSDGRPSLSVRETLDGTVLIHCFAGCEKTDILAAVGSTWADLFPRGVRYDYTAHDDHGEFVTVKTVTRSYDGNVKRFAQSGDTKAHLLYNLPRVEQSVAIGSTIYVVEGEKDVAAAGLIGLVATTVDGGAMGAGNADWSALHGADVIVCGDQDAAGEKFVATVVEQLAGKAKSLRIARPAKGFKDLADHVAARLGADDLRVKRKDLSAPGAAPAASRDSGGTSWLPQDVADARRQVRAGEVARPTPTIGYVEGLPTGLFYPGRVHGIHGESGSGKGWVLILALAQEIARGENVVYIDYEDDVFSAIQRLLDVGADDDAIDARFTYIHPDEHSAAGIAGLIELVDELRPTLVGIDSTGEGLSVDGVQPNADEEVAAWFRRIPRTIADRGPAVVNIDHSPKATGDGELFPIGSQRKRSAVNGAQYLLRDGDAFSQGVAGFSTLVVAKDRGGTYAKRSKVARLAVSAEGVFTLTAEQAPRAEFRPTSLMDKVSRCIEDAASPPSMHKIEKAVDGGKATIALAVAKLADEGFIRRDPGPRNATLHTSLKPYRASADPRSDSYVPAPAATFPVADEQAPKKKPTKRQREFQPS